MNVNSLLKQNWNVPIGRARQIQMELAGKIAYKGPVDSIEKVKIVAGVDVSYDKNNQTFVSLVICSFPDMKEIERICFAKIFSNLMPYIPQYLSFREVPPVLSAFKKLKTMPDVILVDGQGIAHPRRIGLATHLGILLHIPTIGCAKSHLYGTYEDPPPGLYGAYTFLKDESAEIIGIVLRTRMFVKPLFVSTGHMINLEVAGDIVMGCLKKRRIPEPLRLAHIYTQQGRKRRKK